MIEKLYRRINAVYKDAIGERRPADVNVIDLLPAIFESVADAGVDDVIEALRWQAERDKQQAEQSRRLGRPGH